MSRILKLEPAMIRGAVVAILALVASLGLAISDEQQGAIVSAVMAVVALLQAVATRQAVVPAAALPASAAVHAANFDAAAGKVAALTSKSPEVKADPFAPVSPSVSESYKASRAEVDPVHPGSQMGQPPA